MISLIADIFTLVSYYQNIAVIVSFAPDIKSSGLDCYLSFVYGTPARATASTSTQSR
jgi:hypothetical protein